MEKIVLLAMKKTKDYSFLWYEDELVCAIIEEAIKLGWLLRTSHTQVEWTEKGAQTYRESVLPL